MQKQPTYKSLRKHSFKILSPSTAQSYSSQPSQYAQTDGSNIAFETFNLETYWFPTMPLSTNDRALMNELYRFGKAGDEQRNPQRPPGTRRPPGNVPYVIDNLWEWQRPDDMPSRRYSVYASPRPEIARQMGSAIKGQLYRVIVADAKMAQIPQIDAKHHPDVQGSGNLAKLLLEKLGQSWLEAHADQKATIARLWAPCLSKDELEETFALEPLATIRQSMGEAVTFWKSARMVVAGCELPYPEGEVFFEAKSWELIPVEDIALGVATAPLSDKA
jgi:hypothetical protein